MKSMFVVFLAVFLAELGDKTQIATLLFATDRDHSPLMVFLAASIALVASTGLAVALGVGASRWIQAVPLKPIAGVGFILIGLWTILDHLRS